MGTNRGIPIYVDRDGSPIANPDSTIDKPVWFPANKPAKHLMRIVEVCRDIKLLLDELVAHPSPQTSKRRVKQLAVPLQTLTESVKSMYQIATDTEFGLLSAEARLYLKNRDDAFNASTQNIANLKIVRNKMSAHLDMACIESPEEFWKKIDLTEFLTWLGICLVEVFAFLHVSVDIFAWSRESGHPEVASLMSSDGDLVDFHMKDGNLLRILHMTIVPSPKFGIATELRELVKLYNRFAEKGLGITGLRVYMTDHRDDSRRDVTYSASAMNPLLEAVQS